MNVGFMKIVKKRDAETLIPIIKEVVKEESMIHLYRSN